MTLPIRDGHAQSLAPKRSPWRSCASKTLTVVEKTAPFAIIGGLLAAALLVHPKATGLNLPEVLISPRDRFYGGAAVDAASLWVVGGDGKILRSDDNGATWALQKSGVIRDLQDIVAWNGRQAVAVGDGGTLLTTADGGDTWDTVSLQAEGYRPSKLLRVTAFGDGRAVAVGEFQTILLTSDYGKTWRLGMPQRDVTLYGVSVTGGRDIWVAGELGILIHSTDGGQTFAEMPKPSELTLNAIAFDDADTGIVAGLKGLLLLTTDGGKTWVPQESRTSEHFFDVMWHDHRWLAAGDKGVFVGGAATGATEWHAPGALDSFWHSKLFTRDGGKDVYACGGDIGVISDNAWHEFKS